MMDVEDRSSIITAAQQVAAQVGGSGLDGLVNVAGIGIVGPVEYVTARDLQRIFDVNVFGQIAVTQAFLPLIREKRGRIANISSVGAHIAIPFAGLLNASKSAFGCFSDTLRLELRPFGIRVITIEPGSIATPAVEKTLGDVEGVHRQSSRSGPSTIRRHPQACYTARLRTGEERQSPRSRGSRGSSRYDRESSAYPIPCRERR